MINMGDKMPRDSQNIDHPLKTSQAVAGEIAEFMNRHPSHADIRIHDVIMSLYINFLLTMREGFKREKPELPLSGFDASMMKVIENFVKEAISNYILNVSIEDQKNSGRPQ